MDRQAERRGLTDVVEENLHHPRVPEHVPVEAAIDLLAPNADAMLAPEHAMAERGKGHGPVPADTPRTPAVGLGLRRVPRLLDDPAADSVAVLPRGQRWPRRPVELQGGVHAAGLVAEAPVLVHSRDLGRAVDAVHVKHVRHSGRRHRAAEPSSVSGDCRVPVVVPNPVRVDAAEPVGEQDLLRAPRVVGDAPPVARRVPDGNRRGGGAAACRMPGRALPGGAVLGPVRLPQAGVDSLVQALG
mmetsp:Transcript_41674/g.98876  ORF Transcript_41674/g.98876 Transcript_41674/m.98876 type:complete len:243 (-) Transcript_41674:103-831(-)